MDDMRKEFERMTTMKAREVLNDDTAKVDFSVLDDGQYTDTMLQTDWGMFEYACRWQIRKDIAICAVISDKWAALAETKRKDINNHEQWTADGAIECSDEIDTQYMVSTTSYDPTTKTAILVDNA